MDENEKVPHYEQKKWEQDQMSSAVFRFGAKNREDEQKAYDLILENQIEFVNPINISGTPGIEDEDVCL